MKKATITMKHLFVIAVMAVMPNCVLVVDDDFEPNDSRQEAYSIDLDTTYNAEITTVDDVDYFIFTTSHPAEEYDLMQITITNEDEELTLHLELYATDGELLDDETADTGADLSYQFVCPGDEYIIRISGWDPVMHSDKGSMGSYSFMVENQFENDSFEPNHTIDDAAVIDLDTEYNGVIVSMYEDDFFEIINPSPDYWTLWTIQFTNIADTLACNVEIYDSYQDLVYFDNGDKTAGSDLILDYYLMDDSSYIKVNGWDNVMHNEHGSRGSYTLEVVQTDNDSNEPDDSFEDARIVSSFPGEMEGTVLVDAANDNGGDYEFFEVSLDDGKEVHWSIDPEASNTELHFSVYDSDLTYLGNYDGDDGETITGSMSNSSGSDDVFYIKLGGYIGDSGEYSISFTETDAS